MLVTGASRGIGAVTARILHGQGASVVIHYGSQAAPAHALAAELGDGTTVVGGDLADPARLASIWEEALLWRGRIDALVNNAGAWIASPIEDKDSWDAGWASNLGLNLTAPAELCRLAIEHFRKRGGGIIVNVTSRSAHRGDDVEHLAYGAAKAGLLALTKGIARGCGKDGVLAYAVAPGWVATDLADGHVAEDLAAHLPLGEVTPPEDVAELIAFLASGKCRHATGATIDVTGADYVR
ncbi:NAD-dependent epimerase [Zafaria cholistanensis]|uniref:NAD-dependent epimerase n=1 Tax=Zafaria cholistanensis TaxID=1682741 RepID=A0A5A7NUA8_9MICC|nr:SDR family oxidoreductase [Zafaria cholistanensis]GER23732.1 NAD-dependent epimerase [Zafaria cholistanensis]